MSFGIDETVTNRIITELEAGAIPWTQWRTSISTKPCSAWPRAAFTSATSCSNQARQEKGRQDRDRPEQASGQDFHPADERRAQRGAGSADRTDERDAAGARILPEHRRRHGPEQRQVGEDGHRGRRQGQGRPARTSGRKRKQKERCGGDGAAADQVPAALLIAVGAPPDRRHPDSARDEDQRRPPPDLAEIADAGVAQEGRIALYFCTPDRSASLRARGAPLRRPAASA